MERCQAILPQITDPEQLTFARYAHRTVSSPVTERMIHIGDAWHSASPQLGQGANMALLDAFALSQGLAMDAPLAGQLAQAMSLRRSHVRLNQLLTAAFTPLYQSTARWPALLRDLVLVSLGRIPPGPALQASLVAGLAGNPLGSLGLAMPDYDALIASSTSAREAASVQSRSPK